MSEVDGSRYVSAKPRVLSQSSTCEICGRHNGTRLTLCPKTSIFPCKYSSANVPYVFSS